MADYSDFRIVVRVNETGSHGLIMSLEKCAKKWINDGDEKFSTNAYFEDDGEKNMANLRKPFNESPIISGHSNETLDSLGICWRFLVQNVYHFLRIHSQSIFVYYVTQEHDFIDPELALTQLRKQLVLSKST